MDLPDPFWPRLAGAAAAVHTVAADAAWHWQCPSLRQLLSVVVTVIHHRRRRLGLVLGIPCFLRVCYQSRHGTEGHIHRQPQHDETTVYRIQAANLHMGLVSMGPVPVEPPSHERPGPVAEQD
jgi:hypothetical protein